MVVLSFGTDRQCLSPNKFMLDRRVSRPTLTTFLCPYIRNYSLITFLCHEPVSTVALPLSAAPKLKHRHGSCVRLGVPSSTLSHRGGLSSNGNSDDASGSPFSRSPGQSGRNSPYPPTNGSYGAQRFAEDLEGQNDERLEGLTAKVKLLKDVSARLSYTASI